MNKVEQSEHLNVDRLRLNHQFKMLILWDKNLSKNDWK